MKFSGSRLPVASLILLSLASADAGAQTLHPGFPVNLAGVNVESAGVALGDVNGDLVPDIVVAGIDGRVYAYRGDNAQVIFSIDTGDMPINAKVGIANIDADAEVEIIVATGAYGFPNTPGALHVLNHLGQVQCSFTPGDFDNNTVPDAILSMPALADIDRNDGGLMEIAFAGFDGFVRLINHDCTPIWSFDNRDTNASSAGIVDLDRDGFLDVVVGAGTHFEPPPSSGHNGGLVQAFNRFGAYLPGWPKELDEVVASAQAIGDIDGNGSSDVVVGTGICWSNFACAPTYQGEVGKYLNAYSPSGVYLPGWPKLIPGEYVENSVAMGNLDADPELESVFAATRQAAAGTFGGTLKIYAVNHDGSNMPGFPMQPLIPTGMGSAIPQNFSSPLLADIVGDSAPEIIVGAGFEVIVVGANGIQLSRAACCPNVPDFVFGTEYLVNASPAIGDVDGDGLLELVVASARFGGNPGAIFVWDLTKPATSAQPWPQQRRTADNHGNIPVDVIFRNGFQ